MFNVVSILPKIIVLVVFIVGLFNAINPRFFWKKFESWKAKEEPSKEYFMVKRIAGIIAMIGAIIMLFFPQLTSRGF